MYFYVKCVLCATVPASGKVWPVGPPWQKKFPEGLRLELRFYYSAFGPQKRELYSKGIYQPVSI